MTNPGSKDPLHGITLEALLNALVARYGWAELAQRVNINCFKSDPSIKSSLKFLRRTPWARAEVEALYLALQDALQRHARPSVAHPAEQASPPACRPARGVDPAKRADRPDITPPAGSAAQQHITSPGDPAAQDASTPADEVAVKKSPLPPAEDPWSKWRKE